MTAKSAPDDVTTTCEAPGEAIEHQVFDLPPDNWHYVTFKLKHTQVSSNPPVPLNTTLFELFEVADTKKRDDESEEIQDAKWPYSSISRERFLPHFIFLSLGFVAVFEIFESFWIRM